MLVRIRTSGGELVCIMSDLDFFKQVNDTHGHAMGDEVLQTVAEALRSEMRATDQVCRWGGEEFCLGLADVPVERAVEITERLRRKIDSPDFCSIPVSMSFGVAYVHDGTETTHELLCEADTALYASKAAGRNRVTRFDLLDPES